MGLPEGTAQCPTCGGALKRAPQRQTKCPHCNDYIYLKYRPGEKPEQRQLVGSKEAAEIEAAWTKRDELERDVRYASYARDRAATVKRILEDECPPWLVMFYVRFVGPLRDGDLFDARECHDKLNYPRVMDLSRRAIVPLEDWHRQTPVPAPMEPLIRSFVSGSSIDLIDEATGFVKRAWVTIPEDWRQPWPIQTAQG